MRYLGDLFGIYLLVSHTKDHSAGSPQKRPFPYSLYETSKLYQVNRQHETRDPVIWAQPITPKQSPV
jgi:hypothetical protein